MKSFLDPAVLSAIVLAVLGLVGTYITNRQNRAGAKATEALTSRQTMLDERAVDRQDFKDYVERQDIERARLEKRIADQDLRIAELETRLEAEVDARQRAEDRAEKADARAERAEKRADALARRVTQLEKTLREHGIPVPPPVDPPNGSP